MREGIIGTSYVQPPIPVPEFRFTNSATLWRSTDVTTWRRIWISNPEHVELLYRDLESNQPARFFYQLPIDGAAPAAP
jgi:hypothetical protein